MAKNITIKEGATAKNFTGVKKITTNQMGGGSVSWIPEDEAVDYVNLKTITARKNGTYKAEDNACDGFSEVKVEVPADVKDKVITTNGEYLAAEDNCLGYRKVTVNVSGGGSGSGQHTVIFYAADRTTVLEKQVVEDFGGAIYHGDTPTATGMRFVGWSPNPINVRSDLNCYPRFENLIYDDTQILDDWITIIRNIRTNPNSYNIGQWKLMEFGYFQPSDISKYGNEWIETIDNVVYIKPFAVKMRLIGKGIDQLEGQNGYAASTWISDEVTPFKIQLNHAFLTDSNDTTGWKYSFMKKELEERFYPQAFPEEVRPHLRRVIKYSYGRESAIWVNNQTSIDFLFIPSAREFGSTEFEQNGVIYDVYSSNDARKKTTSYSTTALQYWLRSVNNSRVDGDVKVMETGEIYNYEFTLNPKYIPICFCL